MASYRFGTAPRLTPNLAIRSVLGANTSSLDQSNLLTTSSRSDASSSTEFGQTFTPSVSGYLNSVTFRLQITGGGSPTATIEVDFWATSAGLPTGTALATTAAVTASGSAQTDYAFTFAPLESPLLVASTVYGVSLRRTDSNSLSLTVRGAQGNPYSAGQGVISSDSGVSWLSIGSGFDCYFKTYMGQVPALGNPIQADFAPHPRLRNTNGQASRLDGTFGSHPVLASQTATAPRLTAIFAATTLQS